ncbi:MAG: branched-chain amino acid ABC transporter permease [Chloroflexales bacterium]|nr:branched-chain amino acid ABC transporter permease [Chloroflexales bacterium]
MVQDHTTSNRPPGRVLRSVGQYAAVAAFALALPWIIGFIPGLSVSYVMYLVGLGLIFGIVAIGLNLLIGYAGQFSLGHAGFLAIGAYTSAILTERFGWPFLAAFAAAGLLTGVVGFLLGLPALRLSGPYLAVVTLGFGLAIPQLVVWQGDLTGGSSGIHGMAPATIPSWYDPVVGLYLIVFDSEVKFYYFILATLVVLTVVAVNVVNSHTGRAFIAIRDSELAALAMGVNLMRYKTTAFALSAFYAGIAGSLYAHLIRGISPENFTIYLSIEFLAMIVLGGLGSIRGALIGAFVLTALQHTLTRLPVISEFQNLYIVVFGAILILTVMFFPRGIAGALRGAGLRRPGRNRVTQPPEKPDAPADVDDVVIEAEVGR